MNLISQFKLCLVDSLVSLKNIRKNTILWFFIYYALGVAIFGLLTWYLLENQIAIKNTILDYLFPKSWQSVSETLADFLFESQAKIVIGNMVISGSLVLASVFLFPVKEKLSQSFEKESGFHKGQYQEFSLFQQAIEESKLLLFYFSFQSFILWVGYYPFIWSTWIAIVLSYLFLFFTFGLDFISPTLQRHKTKYAVILKALIKRPLIPLLFGALFSLPTIMLTHFLFKNNENTLIKTISIILISNLFLLAIAIPVGTTIACRVKEFVKKTIEPKQKTMIQFYSFMSVMLIFSLFLHSRLILSLHHKSQLLKAEYDIDWSSMNYELPSFTQLTQGKAFSNLTFEMVIKNPTEFDIDVENSLLYITQNDKEIATISLNSFSLPSGDTRRIKIDLGSDTDFSNLSEFKHLMDGWKVNMEIDVWPGIPFLFNLTQPEN